MNSFPTSNPLFCEFSERLALDRMLKPKEKILIACSGGPDSVLLTRWMTALATSWGWRLAVAYFDHGLRRAAKREKRFVQGLARECRAKFYFGLGKVKAESKKHKESLEESARRLRYQFLIASARAFGARTILSAHTLDDQAETVLMRLLQGTGTRGLAGIRRWRSDGGVSFYRPLLDYRKALILSELRKMKQPFCRDLSNGSPRFLRNRIRIELLPLLEKKYNPRAASALARFPEILSDDLQLLEALEQQAWKKVFQKKQGRELFLKPQEFRELAPSLQFRILDRALKSIHASSGLNFEAWKKIKSQIHASTFQFSLPKDLLFYSRRGRMGIRAAFPRPE